MEKRIGSVAFRSRLLRLSATRKIWFLLMFQVLDRVDSDFSFRESIVIANFLRQGLFQAWVFSVVSLEVFEKSCCTNFSIMA